MVDSNPLSLESFPAQSPHRTQLQHGFPWLRFVPTLEREFRQALRAEQRPSIRRNLWIAVISVIGFAWLTHMVLEPSVSRQLDGIRFAVFAPLLLINLLLVHSRWYQKLYPISSVVSVPIFGSGVALVTAIAATHGVSLIATVVLLTIFVYFMLGLLFYQALVGALSIFVAYLLIAHYFDVPATQLLVDGCVLVFTNLMGAMVCFTLERANRTNFLEEALLTDIASRDGLTGINNRRVFDVHLERIWAQAARERVPVALLLIDIDHFKAYNDRYGHQVGDECLRRVAQCLVACARRPLDVTARYGGEEFAIVLYDARREYIENFAREIRQCIQALAIEHLASPQKSKQVTVSIGAACVEYTSGRSHYGFIQLADEALYTAKERGRDCLVIMDKEYERMSTGSFRGAAR